MKINSPLVAVLSFGAALAAWVGVVSFALQVQNMAGDAASVQSAAQKADDERIALLQTHTLAHEVAPARAQLETLLQTDPLSLVALIGQAGRDAHVALEVSDASPESAYVPTTARGHGAPIGPPPPATIGFTVNADGTFTSLVQAALFLELLPVPSAITELDVSSEPTGAGVSRGKWHLNAHLRILTASQISS